MNGTWTKVEDGDCSDDSGCCSVECPGKAEWYFEAGGTGSYYCPDCKARIEDQEENAHRIAEEEYYREMEATHR